MEHLKALALGLALLVVTHAVYARLYMRWLRHGGQSYRAAAWRRCAVMAVAVVLLAVIRCLADGSDKPWSQLAPVLRWAGDFVCLIMAWELVYMWVFGDEGYSPEALMEDKKKKKSC